MFAIRKYFFGNKLFAFDSLSLSTICPCGFTLLTGQNAFLADGYEFRHAKEPLNALWLSSLSRICISLLLFETILILRMPTYIMQTCRKDIVI